MLIVAEGVLLFMYFRPLAQLLEPNMTEQAKHHHKQRWELSMCFFTFWFNETIQTFNMESCGGMHSQNKKTTSMNPSPPSKRTFYSYLSSHKTKCFDISLPQPKKRFILYRQRKKSADAFGRKGTISSFVTYFVLTCISLPVLRDWHPRPRIHSMDYLTI